MNETHTQPTTKSVCPQCGTAFVCGVAAGGLSTGELHCWCFDLSPVMSVRADTSCLCPACLTRAIQQKEQQQ